MEVEAHFSRAAAEKKNPPRDQTLVVVDDESATHWEKADDPVKDGGEGEGEGQTKRQQERPRGRKRVIFIKKKEAG